MNLDSQLPTFIFICGHPGPGAYGGGRLYTRVEMVDPMHFSGLRLVAGCFERLPVECKFGLGLGMVGIGKGNQYWMSALESGPSKTLWRHRTGHPDGR